MADKDGLKVAKDYHTDVPFGNQGSFHVKGANNTDWGMKRHLSNIFDPVSGNTVMFAFDHGYFMGSTAGLERLDLVIPKLQEQVDVFMGTRGAIRTCVSPTFKKGIALRVTSGSSMINDDLSHECLAVDVEDAIRMNADCMAVQTFIGADGQLSSIDNLSRCINAGMRYSIPTLGVVAVGKDMDRPLLQARDPHRGRDGCAARQDLLLRQLRGSRRGLPGADRRRRRQEAPGG